LLTRNNQGVLGQKVQGRENGILDHPSITNKPCLCFVFSSDWLYGAQVCRASPHLAGMEPASYKHNIKKGPKESSRKVEEM
jgi:hypothetical protein